MLIKYETGVSLVEVLVTISLLSFGVLGIAGMQTSAIANTHLAHQHSQAALLAQSIAENMRANPTAVAAGLYQHSVHSDVPSASNNCAASFCTPSELALWNLATWNAYLTDSNVAQKEFPEGRHRLGLTDAKLSIICQKPCDAHSIQLITVYWDARRNGATGTACDPSSLSDLIYFRLAYAS